VTGPGIESELKLRADDEAPLRELAARSAIGPANLGRARVVDERDRYLDTADLRLAARRWACRLRTREGVTTVSLKGRAEHAAGAALHARPELNGPATASLDPATWPPSEARDALRAMSLDAPLTERFALEQERTERTVEIGTRRVGILSLDRTRVLHRGAVVGRLYVVELELESTALAVPHETELLAVALRRVDGLRLDPLSKLEHALEMIGALPA